MALHRRRQPGGARPGDADRAADRAAAGAGAVLRQGQEGEPRHAEPYLASGELALDKHDYALAAEAFQDAVKRDPEDPDVYFGLAGAFENDSERATAALNKALELNPQHVDSLLFQADNLIDREEYDRGRGDRSKKVLEINPHAPAGWAYRAVLAHLTGDRQRRRQPARRRSAPWDDQPRGRSPHRPEALAEVPLRRGGGVPAAGAEVRRRPIGPRRCSSARTCCAWARKKRAGSWRRRSSRRTRTTCWRTTSSRCTTLDKFRDAARTSTSWCAWTARGGRSTAIACMRLLERARKKLCAKYGVELSTSPVTVEIFPQQQDFAIRTFGLPGGAGFLGRLLRAA